MSFFIKCPRLCPFLLFLIVWTAFADYDRRIFFITFPPSFPVGKYFQSSCHCSSFLLSLPLIFLIFQFFVFFRFSFPSSSPSPSFLLIAGISRRTRPSRFSCFPSLCRPFSFSFYPLIPGFFRPAFSAFYLPDSLLLLFLSVFARRVCRPASGFSSLSSLFPFSCFLVFIRLPPDFLSSFSPPLSVSLPPHFLFSQQLPRFSGFSRSCSPVLKTGFYKNFLHTDA